MLHAMLVELRIYLDVASAGPVDYPRETWLGNLLIAASETKGYKGHDMRILEPWTDEELREAAEKTPYVSPPKKPWRLLDPDH